MCAMVDLQVVTDEVMVGVLLDANEKIVEAIQKAGMMETIQALLAIKKSEGT